MRTLTSETASSEYHSETKIQGKCDISDENFERPEKDLVDFMEQQHQESKNIEK